MMSAKPELASIQEFQVHLENVVVRLWVGESWALEKNNGIHVQETHTHICPELFVCGTGEVILKTEEGYIHLYAGDAAIVPPGIHHMKYSTAPGTEGYALSFLCIHKNIRDCTDLYRKFLPFLSGKQILVWRNQPELFQDTVKIIRESEKSADYMPAFYMAELLRKAADLPVYSANADEKQDIVSQFHDTQRALKLDQFISNFYMQDWNMEDIASQFHISSRQLDRIVRKRYGKTLHEVIMDKRIRTAEQLLITTSYTVEKIAVTVGFSSCAGFYREFSKRFSDTPAEYRKKNLTMADC